MRIVARHQLDQQFVQVKAAQQCRFLQRQQAAHPFGRDQGAHFRLAAPGQRQGLEGLQHAAQLRQGALGALGHQGDAAVIARKDVDDQAGFLVRIAVQDEGRLVVDAMHPVARSGRLGWAFRDRRRVRRVRGRQRRDRAGTRLGGGDVHSMPRLFVAVSAQAGFVVGPAGFHLDPDFQVHRAAEQAFPCPAAPGSKCPSGARPCARSASPCGCRARPGWRRTCAADCLPARTFRSAPCWYRATRRRRNGTPFRARFRPPGISRCDR